MTSCQVDDPMHEKERTPIDVGERWCQLEHARAEFEELLDEQRRLGEDLVSGGMEAPSCCPSCGRDVQPTAFDIDRVLALEDVRERGGGNRWGA